MSERVHVVTDGKWPKDREPDEWVVVVPTAQNAAMWLEMGEPIEAFIALESVIGWQAFETFKREGFPVVEVEAFDGKLRADAPFIYANLLAAVAHVERGGEATDAAMSAIGALDALRRGREAIGETEPNPALADVVTRGVLAGYAAARMGVDPAAMTQPDPGHARQKRSEYQERWREEVRTYLRELSSTKPEWLLFPAKMLWLGFQWERGRKVALIKASSTTKWPSDDTAHKFIQNERRAL